MHIRLDRSSKQSLYIQLAQDIQGRIRSGALPPGTRLPTVRELAQQLGVTRLTVHNAYSELQAGGWIEATVGRGTFVAQRAVPVYEQIVPNRDISAHSVITDMLRMAHHPAIASLAMADAAPEFYPLREIQRAIDEAIASEGAALFRYSTSQGDLVLRVALAEMLRERGLSVVPDELLVTSGVTQGLALIAQTLARPGDTVVVEQPTYLGALNVLTAQGLRPVGVPMDEQGMLVDQLEALIQRQRPRFIYTIPVFQNPSGVCMSDERRAALLALAERHRIPVVEDDIYSQLAYEGTAPPALQSQDRTGLVLHVGSFSKAVLPGTRIGYVAAAAPFLERLVLAKQSHDLCAPLLMQRTMAIFIQRGWMANHLRRVVPLYRERRDALLSAMARWFPSSLHWTTPRGGFCSWVTLPPGLPVADLYLAAMERGIAFAPGDVFFPEPAPRPHLRLTFSLLPPDELERAVQTLGELLSTQTRRRISVPRVNDYVPLV